MTDDPLTAAQFHSTIGDAVGYAMAHNARMAADDERRARHADPADAHLHQDNKTEED